MKISEYDVNDTPLSRALAGKRSAIFDIVMGFVTDDLTSQEVNKMHRSKHSAARERARLVFCNYKQYMSDLTIRSSMFYTWFYRTVIRF